MVENFVAKEEIPYHEQILLLPQYFETLSAADASKCEKGLRSSLMQITCEECSADPF